MIERHEYLCPDYYAHFSCKIGACRFSCCDGWPVSLAIEDYYHLLGVDCSPRLRREIDCALHILPDPFPEKYAEISHRYDGRCHMRLPDGRCAIHAEIGGDHLPAICRLYPRAIRSEGDYEASCTSSCERVVELLMEHPAPLRFEKLTLSVDLPDSHGSTVFNETIPHEQAIRLSLIAILQDRALPLPLRFPRLADAMRRLDSARFPAPASTAPLSDITRAFFVMETLLAGLDCHSDSLHDYGETVLARYRGDDGGRLFLSDRLSFEKRFPAWESLFENLIANHMFYCRFPFSDGSESLRDEYISLAALYDLMRLLAIGYTAIRNKKEDLVDLLAAVFRLVDHTPFHHYTPLILSDISHDLRYLTLL